MAISDVTLGSAIKSVRIARGLTQSQLAQAAGLSSVALIEQGKRSVSMDSLNSIAAALGIPGGCLVMLGTSTAGGDEVVTDLVKSVQKLIHALVLAQSKLRSETKAKKLKIRATSTDRKRPVNFKKSANPIASVAAKTITAKSTRAKV